MTLRDFSILFLVCLFWGFNFVVSKWLVSGGLGVADFGGVPPLFMSAIRFGVLALILSPFLVKVPKRWKTLVLASVFVGALNFGLLFVGVKYANPSATAVAIQLMPVFTTALSVVFLGERVGWRRALGMGLALGGVALVALQPQNLQLSVGIAIVCFAAFVGSIGQIIIKAMKEIGVWQFQAWMAALSAPLLLTASLILETGQVAATVSGGWPLVLAFSFVILAGSLFGFWGYFTLLRKYDASEVTFLSLMAPIWGMVFGVLVYGDPVNWKLFVGAAMVLGGVAVIALRSRQRKAAELALEKCTR